MLVGYLAVYRICFGMAAFFFLFMILNIGVGSSKDCRGGLNNGWGDNINYIIIKLDLWKKLKKKLKKIKKTKQNKQFICLLVHVGIMNNNYVIKCKLCHHKCKLWSLKISLVLLWIMFEPLVISFKAGALSRQWVKLNERSVCNSPSVETLCFPYFF